MPRASRTLTGSTESPVEPHDATPSRGFWDDADVVHVYTRAQAIGDGVLVDAQVGELAEVTRQHHGAVPVAMTAGVHALIERAVASPRHCNDWRGVWHDVLWMARVCPVAIIHGEVSERRVFTVIITGTGRTRNHQLVRHVGPGDHGGPVVTYMLPGED